MFFDISNMELSPVQRDIRVASAEVGDSIFILDEEINEWVDSADMQNAHQD
jgi:hypothetical protein